MIVPTALLSQDSYKGLRKCITDDHKIESLIRLPNESFGEAAGDVKVDTVIFVVCPWFCEKQSNKYYRLCRLQPNF